MRKSDAVRSYLQGELDRRGLIRRLSAVGVTSGAAVYASSFGQPAVMAADRNVAGFLAQTEPDEDYGIAIIIENLLAALQSIADLIQRIIGRLLGLLASIDGITGINAFASAQGQIDQAQVLESIRSQINDHADALSVLYPDLVVTPAAAEEDVAMEAVASDYNTLVGVYAALLPNLEDPEQVQTMTQIAIVGGRHASLLSSFAGLDPVPAAFEEPIDPTSVV